MLPFIMFDITKLFIDEGLQKEFLLIFQSYYSGAKWSRILKIPTYKSTNPDNVKGLFKRLIEHR